MLPKEGTQGKFMVPFINGRYLIPGLVLISVLLFYVYNHANFLEFFSFSHESLTPMQVFINKIPYLSFFALVIIMSILSFVKKLSVIPVLGLLSCFYLMTELGINNWMRFGVWLLIGILIYLVYGYRNSKMSNK
jgi:hypothetical protein